jgi:hypothetical protein
MQETPQTLANGSSVAAARHMPIMEHPQLREPVLRRPEHVVSRQIQDLSRINLNPALNAPECAAAGCAGKARGGRRITPCNDEQRSQRIPQLCHRVRSGLTQKVRPEKGEKR